MKTARTTKVIRTAYSYTEQDIDTMAEYLRMVEEIESELVAKA